MQVNTRFFAALDALIIMGKLQMKIEFCTRYGIDPGNFTRLRKDPYRAFELAYLSYLVEDYGVSADWLITGRGRMIA